MSNQQVARAQLGGFPKIEKLSTYLYIISFPLAFVVWTRHYVKLGVYK